MLTYVIAFFSGFGFVTFVDSETVELVSKCAVHQLDGKKIDPKVAFPKESSPKMVTRTKKIFVGGLSTTTTLEEVKTYFTKFGEVNLSVQVKMCCCAS